MKKTFLAAIIAAGCMTLTSCGLGTDGTTTNSTAATTTTTTTTGATTGTVANLLSSSTTQNVLTGLLSSLLQTTTTAESIPGTWTYSAPEVRFESENLLAKAGGMVVANQVKTKMETYLTKFGMTAGKSTFTFTTNNGTNSFTATLGSKTIVGTWSYDSSTNKLTMKDLLGLLNINCTCSVVGNTMYMLFDSSKLLSLAMVLGKSNSTLSSLANSYSGMKMGWAMTK